MLSRQDGIKLVKKLIEVYNVDGNLVLTYMQNNDMIEPLNAEVEAIQYFNSIKSKPVINQSELYKFKDLALKAINEVKDELKEEEIIEEVL